MRTRWIVAVVVFGLGAWLWFRPASPPTPGTVGSGGAASTTRGPPASTPSADDPAAEAGDAIRRRSAASEPTTREGSRGRGKEARQKRIRELRRKIQQAYAEAGPPAEPEDPSPDSDPDEVPTATLEPEVIQDAVRRMKPLLAECYDLAQAEDANVPTGKTIVEFTVLGDPEMGGLIGSSTVSEDSTLRHPILDECVSETLYGLELPSPKGRGEVRVVYPFIFEQTDAP